MKVSPILTGVSGEYFVAAELSRRGYIASITLRNTKGIDILVSNESASRSVGIQVKTKRSKSIHSKHKKWLLNKKAEDYHDKNIYYVFVNLKEAGEKPEYHIVPSEKVAAYVKRTHSEWLKTPGKKGQQHKDNTMRVFRDENNKYLEKWELLGL